MVPTEASARIDCRLRPAQDHAEFMTGLTQVFDDPGIRVEQGGGVHGNTERIVIENVRRGTAIMVDIVETMTRRQP